MKVKNNISCISDYLSTINELNKSYTTQGMANIPCSCKFIYRGVSNEEYKLLPSIFRKTHDNDITGNEFVDNKSYTSYTTEKRILQNFIAEACSYINCDPSHDLHKWAEYAQHYGAPTRFLDWSENPMVALYFACRYDKPDYQEKGGIGGKDATVWMLHLGNYRRFANQVNNIIFSSDRKKELSVAEVINKIYEGQILIKYPIIYTPYYTDLRMSAQSSMFMVWGEREEPLEAFFSNNTMRSNMEKGNKRTFGNHQTEELIFKFHIYASEKQSILRELDNCGINEKTLFPGIDGVGRYVEMKYRFDLNEAKRYL